MREEYESNQSRLAWILGGISLGALAMYLGDPERGRDRRSAARETLRGAVSSTGQAFNVARQDLGSRVQGLRAQADSMLSRGKEQLDDQLLKTRVRQQIADTVSQPSAIDIDVRHGYVTLGGRIPAHERQYLLDAVRRVDGVVQVQDFLEMQEPPASQAGVRGEASTESRMPGIGTIAMIAGGALGMYWLTQRSSTFGAAREPIVVNKTIHVDAAPERVYELWSNYENFPRFMSNVQHVRDLGEGRSHWVVKGPTGVYVEWDARLTDARRGEVLAWQSEPGADVYNSGQVRFEPEGNGTRVSVYMSYMPPAGTLGHAIASLFGASPKQEMDEDLERMKAFIETGRTLGEGAQPAAQPSASTLH